MRKILLSILLLLLGVNVSFAQEKLVDLLKNLSVKNKIINTKAVAEGTNYFELLQSKKIFHIKEHNHTAWYINSQENFSIYQLVWDEAYTEKAYKDYHYPNTIKYGIKFALLFDNEKQRCYMIKYNGTSPGHKRFGIKCIDRYNKIRLEILDFEVGINSIVRLDENFLPIYGTIMNTYKIYTENIEYIDRKEDEFVGLFEFKQCNDTTYRKLLNTPPISINQITEVELAKFFSDEHGYTEYIDFEWEKQDMQKIFESGVMF